jgi:methionyl-tRNA formyltransferase
MKRSIFFGTPDLAVPIAQATSEVTQLVAVVTQPDRPKGRGRELTPPPVKVWALERGLPVLQPTKLRDGTLAAALRDLAPEVAVVAAYGRILPKDLLELPRLGCLNVHASLLPKWRGAAPIQWAVASGDTETGVTLMQMDEGLDTGDMLAHRAIPILPEDTGGSLHDRLAALGATLIREELPRFLAGALQPIPQDDGQATYAKILAKDDGRLDFRLPAEQLGCRVRGFSPWPGAYTYLDAGEAGLLKVHQARPVPGAGAAAPGTVISLRPLLVATGEGALELLEVQPEGRRRMSAEDFVAGRRVEPGQRLDPEWAP